MRFLFLAFLVFALPAFNLAAFAAEPGAEARNTRYDIADAFVRAAPGNVTAAYAVIKNPTEKGDTLVGASADWAGRIELHDVTHDKDGKMEMAAVHEITLPAKGEIALKPGGLHLMVFEVKKKLRPGQKAEITLNFRDAGSVKADFAVRPMTYTGVKPSHKAHH
jgi:periplasmic copper chaperone A